jgi:hypothetical protein
MKGMPEHWNTKKDVMVSLDNNPEQTKSYLQTFVDNVEKWMIDHKLGNGETGITDDTHKVKEITDEETGEVTERYQLEWKEDPNCKLFRLGFTKQEAEDIIQG